MPTDEEILELWGSLPEKMKEKEAIIRLYRLAEKGGMQEGISALEREMLTDSTIEGAIQMYGLGRHMKASTITQRAIIREAIHLARDKVKKKK